MLPDREGHLREIWSLLQDCLPEFKLPEIKPDEEVKEELNPELIVPVHDFLLNKLPDVCVIIMYCCPLVFYVSWLQEGTPDKENKEKDKSLATEKSDVKPDKKEKKG